ncbi:MAG TPA: hypothetical protein VK449_05450, partial [Anaerolineales bacterium]|nr:hypothetical protein [Anaerolineales bacterium]
MLDRASIRHLAGTLLALAAAWLGNAAYAQATGTIQLTPPSSASFPQVAFFASVIGPDGRPVHALPPTSFTLTEDGAAVSDFHMEEETIGARQIYAVNTVAPLRRRDVLGVTRLEQVRQALIDAWQARPASTTPDQVSLMTAEASLARNAPAAADLVPVLEDWAPVYSGNQVGYRPLISALTAALDPVPHPAMQTDVIFFTPLLDRNNEQDLSQAGALAQSSGARLHAVLIGTSEQAGTAEALRLRQAAEASGGTFEVFDPA